MSWKYSSQILTGSISQSKPNYFRRMSIKRNQIIKVWIKSHDVISILFGEIQDMSVWGKLNCRSNSFTCLASGNNSFKSPTTRKEIFWSNRSFTKQFWFYFLCLQHKPKQLSHLLQLILENLQWFHLMSFRKLTSREHHKQLFSFLEYKAFQNGLADLWLWFLRNVSCHEDTKQKAQVETCRFRRHYAWRLAGSAKFSLHEVYLNCQLSWPHSISKDNC